MAETTLTGHREKLLSSIKKKALLTDGPYDLSSGRPSSYYINMKPLLNDEQDLTLISRLLLAAIPKIATAVGGLATGSISISTSMFLENRKLGSIPHALKGFWVREEEKDHGLSALVEGNLTASDRVVIVDDVTTTGTSLMKAVEAVRSVGAEILMVISIVDRGQGAKERLAAEGLDFHSLFSREDL